jgi:hypothetical protein
MPDASEAEVPDEEEQEEAEMAPLDQARERARVTG